MIYLIILSFLGIVVSAGFLTNTIIKSRATAPQIAPQKRHSEAAKKLIAQYNRLPENHRPNIDIVTSVEALDVKHGINNVNTHFTAWLDFYIFSWFAEAHSSQRSGGSRCTEKECEFYSYYRLHAAMNDIVKALETQAHELAVAGIQHDLDSLDSVYEELRSETKVIESVTKDLTGK